MMNIEEKTKGDLQRKLQRNRQTGKPTIHDLPDENPDPNLPDPEINDPEINDPTRNDEFPPVFN